MNKYHIKYQLSNLWQYIIHDLKSNISSLKEMTYVLLNYVLIDLVIDYSKSKPISSFYRYIISVVLYVENWIVYPHIPFKVFVIYYWNWSSHTGTSYRNASHILRSLNPYNTCSTFQDSNIWRQLKLVCSQMLGVLVFEAWACLKLIGQVLQVLSRFHPHPERLERKSVGGK